MSDSLRCRETERDAAPMLLSRSADSNLPEQSTDERRARIVVERVSHVACRMRAAIVFAEPSDARRARFVEHARRQWRSMHRSARSSLAESRSMHRAPRTRIKHRPALRADRPCVACRTTCRTVHAARLATAGARRPRRIAVGRRAFESASNFPAAADALARASASNQRNRSARNGATFAAVGSPHIISASRRPVIGPSVSP